MSIRSKLEYLYSTYIALMPAFANFFLIGQLQTQTQVSLYLFSSLFLSVMYIAVRIETLNFPERSRDIIALILSPFMTLLIGFLSAVSLVEMLGMLIFVEITGLLLALLLTAVVGGGIGNMRSFGADLQDISKNPRRIVINIQSIWFVLIFILLMAGTWILSFQPLLRSFSVLEITLGLGIPISIVTKEIVKGLYNRYRNSLDYGFLAIIGMILWIVTFGVAAYLRTA